MNDKLAQFLVAEDDLTPEHHRRISDLLVLAFARYAELFRNASYYYSVPHYRLWLEDEAGDMVAHLDFECRTIGVNGADVLIAGIGEVAVHPDKHGQGLGRELFVRLFPILRDQCKVDFGFLQCRDQVVGFYQSVGWHKLSQNIHEEDIKTGETIVAIGNALILPVCKPLSGWSTAGDVDLRGLPW